MKLSLTSVVLSLACSVTARSYLGARSLAKHSYTLDSIAAARPDGNDVDPVTLYKEYNFSTPIDHFHNDSMYAPHSSGKFNMRYWFDASHYKAGGPVIILLSGEADASERLVYLQKGIVAQLAQATNGIGVVLEHRYYGTSFPTPDLSTKNLRFLTTDQALADTDFFARNVVFEGFEHKVLTAPHTPYIVYGGSYAGAFAAFLRKLYPETFFGAISSSGVTEAKWNYWQYFEPARIYGPAECVKNTQLLTNAVDNILFHNKTFTPLLKKTFGLSELKHDDDFASVLSGGISDLQSLNWDPAVNYDGFNWYCGNLSSNAVYYPAAANLKPTVEKLLEAGGYGDQKAKLTTPMLNWIGFINDQEIAPYAGELVAAYTQHNATTFEQDSLAVWNQRSWPYQYCTQWGFIQSSEGVPKGQLPLVSKALTIAYETLICKYSFGLTKPADTQAINKYGGYNISYPRLAIIGGQRDPWRPVTPLADIAPKRVSTTDEPVILIKNGVHHWDENGLFKNETTATLPPAPIKQAQSQEKAFVLAWMQEWHKTHY